MLCATLTPRVLKAEIRLKSHSKLPLPFGTLPEIHLNAIAASSYPFVRSPRRQGPLGCGPNSGTVSAYAADVPGPVRDIRLGEPEGTEVLLPGALAEPWVTWWWWVDIVFAWFARSTTW